MEKNQNHKNIKVILGLSGGVDSASSLIKLLEEGYDVEAMFMRNWDSAANNDYLGNPNVNESICPQEKDYMDALEVANKLGVKLHRVDFVEEYYKNSYNTVYHTEKDYKQAIIAQNNLNKNGNIDK